MPAVRVCALLFPAMIVVVLTGPGCAPSSEGIVLAPSIVRDGARNTRAGTPPARFVRAFEPGDELDVSCRVPAGQAARFFVRVRGQRSSPLLDVLHRAGNDVPALFDHRLQVPRGGENVPGSDGAVLLFEVHPSPGVLARIGLPDPWRRPVPGASFSEPRVVPPLRGRSLDERRDTLLIVRSEPVLPAAPARGRRRLLDVLAGLRASGVTVSVIDASVTAASRSTLARHADRIMAAPAAEIAEHARAERRRFGERGPYALVLIMGPGETGPDDALLADLRAAGLLARTNLQRWSIIER